MYNYPIDMQYIPKIDDHGSFVVRFTGLNIGTVINPMDGPWEDGHYCEEWTSHTNEVYWKLYNKPIKTNWFDDDMFRVSEDKEPDYSCPVIDDIIVMLQKVKEINFELRKENTRLKTKIWELENGQERMD